MAKVVDHVRKKHNVQVTTGTIASYVKGKVRQG
jgi:predicted small metal-binding protein